MKKIILLAFVACVVTACETMDSVKSGFSSSYTKVSNLFTSREAGAPCPSFVVNNELDDFYKIPHPNQGSQSVSNAKIEKINGQCRFNNNNDVVTVSMDIDFRANTNANSSEPKLTKEKLEIPYFIAVLDENQDILAKDNFTIPLELSGAAMDTFHKERLQQNIPLSAGRDPSKYTIITGFQLTDTQLAYAKTQDKMATITPAAGTPTPPKENSVPVRAVPAPNPDTIEAADPFAGR